MFRLAKTFLAAIALFAASFAGAEAPPSVPKIVIRVPAVRDTFPADTARISFTVLHTRDKNWLQVQIEPVGACQKLVVDSARGLVAPLDSGRIETIAFGLQAHRDVRVWWRLLQEYGKIGCADVGASRYMVELPAVRKNDSSDSVYTSWLPREIEAVGPKGRIDRGFPEIVDQAGNTTGVICPVYDCMMMCYASDSDGRSAILKTISEQFRQGLPLVRIGSGGAPVRVRADIHDSFAVASLGSLSKWNAGNLVWTEEIPIRTVRAWGTNVPVEWKASNGRRIYEWRNGSVCCDACDSLCEPDSRAAGISSGGVRWAVSNDSTQHCGMDPDFDPGMATDLSDDWLILPDSTEVRSGRLKATFRNSICAGRIRAWRIIDDSISVACVRVAVADLEAAVGVSPRAVRFAPRVLSCPKGIRVSSGLPEGERWTANVRDPSGRILSSISFASPEALVDLDAKGVLLVEVRSSRGSVWRSIAR